MITNSARDYMELLQTLDRFKQNPGPSQENDRLAKDVETISLEIRGNYENKNMNFMEICRKIETEFDNIDFSIEESIVDVPKSTRLISTSTRNLPTVS